MVKQSPLAKEQLASLLRLRNLHNEISKARNKGSNLLIPLLLGCGAGIAACTMTSVPLVFILNPNLSDLTAEKSPIPGCAGLVALLVAWVITTVILQRRAKKQSIGLVSKANTALHSAVEEIARAQPDWVAEIGGKDVLLEPLKVESLLASDIKFENLVRTLLNLNRESEKAADELGRLGDERAVEPLISVLNSNAELSLRQSAARSLGMLEDARAVEPLISVLNSDVDTYLRLAAAGALVKLENERGVVEALEKARSDYDHPMVRQAACYSLAEIKCKNGHTLVGKQCYCQACGLEVHEEKYCVCQRCGRTEHNFVKCTCTKCGATRHEWEALSTVQYRCKRCGAYEWRGERDE